MCSKMNIDENKTYLEKLGYTYNDWEEIYTKEMSSGLSVGYISDWGGLHYYLEVEKVVLGDEAMAKLNADFKELKDDFNGYINYLKKDPNIEVYLDESSNPIVSNKIQIKRKQS